MPRMGENNQRCPTYSRKGYFTQDYATAQNKNVLHTESKCEFFFIMLQSKYLRKHKPYHKTTLGNLELENMVNTPTMMLTVP